MRLSSSQRPSFTFSQELAKLAHNTLELFNLSILFYMLVYALSILQFLEAKWLM